MTIYDIARLSGVSKSTVSRVINDDPKVNKVMRDRVLQVINDINFVPNKAARNILKKKQKTVLILVTRLDSYAENRAIRGIMEEANGLIDFVFFETHFSIELTENIINKNKNIDGIIIFAIGNESYTFLNNYRIPCVFIGQKFDNYPSVYYDDINAMELIFTEIIKEKPNKILYVGLSDEDPTSGYARKHIIEVNCSKNDISLTKIESTFESQDGFNLVKDVDFSKYQAIICATDRLALGVYKHLLKKNLQIPLTGVGDNKNINFIIDNFITVNLSQKSAGREAIKLLMNQGKSVKMPSYLIKK